MKIAVLLTCHNRKEKTLKCLEGLYAQTVLEEITLSTYLVDDGSTDNTPEAVKQRFPQVVVLRGNGSLFWNGGMRLAFSEALKGDYDYYLWLNDDTTIYPNALETLLGVSRKLMQQGHKESAVVGSTQDAITQQLTYGGLVSTSWWHPCHFNKVQPGDSPQPCATMNGNCVLLPKAIVKEVGNLDPIFSHYLGDYDYGLRITKAGGKLWIAPGYVGTCAANISHPKNLLTELSLKEQLVRMGSPKGLVTKEVILYPLKEWKTFMRRHGGLLWPVYWMLPYRRLAVSLLSRKLRLSHS